MKTQDLLELAGRNLRESSLRNTLTTLGIAVGVASLVAMLSLGIGLQELASNRLSRSGLFDTVIVFSQPEHRNTERHPGERNEGRDLRPLDEAARHEMEKLPDVVEVFPEVRFTSEVRYADRSEFTFVSGLSPSARTNDAFDNMQGRFFSAADADETILHMQFAKALADKPETLLGQEVTLRYAQRQAMNDSAATSAPGKSTDPAGEESVGFSVVRKEKKLRVVGLIESEPLGGLRGMFRGRMFIPLALAEKLNTVGTTNIRDLMRTSANTITYQTLMVRVAYPRNITATEQAISKMGFSTFSLLEATRNLRRFFAVLDLFLGIFGSLALAVASLGIINTLVMAILERRREIGIMKALGASDRDVRWLFFAEAGAMGFFGGAAGVTLGWAIGRVINFGSNIWLKRQELPPENLWSVPWWLVAGAIGFAVLVSLISGLYPASRAAKLDPVQALRYE